MKWTRTTAAVLAVLGVMAGGQVSATPSACKKKCDAQAQACSRGKSDTTPCTKAWGQCRKACQPAAKSPNAASPAAPATPQKK
jgi:hypothetical protein